MGVGLWGKAFDHGEQILKQRLIAYLGPHVFDQMIMLLGLLGPFEEPCGVG
jgi:hypothetical protein